MNYAPLNIKVTCTSITYAKPIIVQYPDGTQEEAGESLAKLVRPHVQTGDSVYVDHCHDVNFGDPWGDLASQSVPVIIIGDAPDMKAITDAIQARAVESSDEPYVDGYPDERDLNYTFVVTIRAGKVTVVDTVGLWREQFI